MSLRGFSDEVIAPPAELVFQRGGFDVAEAAGVSVEAMEILGRVKNKDEALESTTEDFTKLAELGCAGRPYILPSARVSFKDMLAAADGKRPDGVAKAYHYDQLWTPGTDKNSYTDKELNQGPPRHAARLAVFSAQAHTDPLLHLTGLPYDNYAKQQWSPDAETTQLDEIKFTKQLFSEQHPEHTIATVDHRALAMLALMDRIEGVDPTSRDFVLSRGFMRIPDLGMREVSDGSFVGDVDSRGSQLCLGGSNGGAGDVNGVGFSVGLKEDQAA